jgi:hypothetical protein
MMNTLEQLRSGQLLGARRLSLACGLTEFPREIFNLADTLEILDLSGNALSSLPDDLPRLAHLRIVFCSDNQFIELPKVLGQCAKLTMVGFKANLIRTVPAEALPAGLRWLVLTDNCIAELPPEIGRCTEMQKLMLAGNQLRALPPEMARCTKLELLRISANRLAELPAFLLTLPRLSWLAFAGNPFCESYEADALTDAPMATIHWDHLRLGTLLGQGASGIIHQAELHHEAAIQDVAVKIFKGDVTSDGLPHCEMTACISAGTHAHLIPVLGKVASHPAGASAMVMDLIDPVFRNLAGPPSLDSCTRDIYGQDTTFDMASALHMARGIASAARHLHARGLMHGDLYAHNILHNGQGHALLGDFGAASFFPTAKLELALALQRLEVRAFSCLLEELVACCPTADTPCAIQTQLRDLASVCGHINPAVRPLFIEIEQVLSTLAA